MISKRLGNFEIISEIGRGGMGVVYRARQISLNREVALKVLPDSAIRDETASQRFIREAHAIAQLSHPNIVDVIEVGEQDGVHYFAMHMVYGTNLAELIQQQGIVKPERAAEIAAQVADALEHAHERGVVHRDIKPANILISRDGRAIVTDFGIAKAIEGNTLTGGHSLTQGSIGTPEYMSPEVIRGNPVDGRTDIYSLGIVLYQMLTGRVPFSAATPFEIANRHLSDPPTPPSALGASCPHWLETILLKALAKEPTQRFTSAAEMASALRNRTVLPLPGASPAPPSAHTDMVSQPAAPHLDQSNLNGQKMFFGLTLPGYVWALAGMGAALLAISLLWLITRTTLPTLSAQSPPPSTLPTSSPSLVTTPAVGGLPLDEARTVLAEQGLVAVRSDNRYDANVPKDCVLEQTPEAGTTVARTSRVDLTVSLGPRLSRTVPDVTGLSQEDARQVLMDAGFSTQIADEEYGTHYPAGRVIAQKPPAGFQQRPGSSVSLTLSLGPKPETVLPELDTFTNVDNGYKINAPRGWSVERSSYEDTGIYYRTEFICPDNDVKMLVDVGPPSGSSAPLDKWRWMDRQFHKKYGDDYQCISLQHTMLGGHPAGYWEFVLTRNGKSYHKIDVGSDVGGHGFAVLCQAPPEQFEQFRNLFKVLIDSFELL